MRSSSYCWFAWCALLALPSGQCLRAEDAQPAVDLAKVVDEAETALLSSKEVKWWGVPYRLGKAFEAAVLVRAAGGLEHSDRGWLKMTALGSRPRARRQIEKALREWRVNGIRPDVPKLTPVLYQAGEFVQRPQAILRFLAEATHSGDATAAAQWFEIAYNDELNDNGYLLGLGPALGIYARSLSDAALRERFPRLEKIDAVDDLLKSAAIWRLQDGDLRTAVRLLSMVSDAKERKSLLEELAEEDSVRLAKSLDDLLFLTAAIAREDEDSAASNLWIISDSLLLDCRYDLALALMESLPQRHPPLAEVAGVWAKELQYRTGDIDRCRAWLDSSDTPATVRPFLRLTIAEHELLHRRQSAAEPLLNEALTELAGLEPEDHSDELELYADRLDAVRDRPEGALRMVAANEPRRVAQTVRLCRACANDTAADAIIQAAIEADKSDDKKPLEKLAERCSEAGDGTSVRMIVESMPKDARESMVPDELIEWGRKMFVAAGDQSAIAWANTLSDPIEKGCALIGVAQAMIMAREPSYSPP